MPRPRDEELDRAILAAARSELVEHGVAGVTYEGVAARAGTSRPAVYRRHPRREDLLVAALASISAADEPSATGDHLTDLVAELRAFRTAITRTHSVTLVGSMLRDDADPEVRAAYRRRLVTPRRERLRRVLERARAAGALDACEDDLEVAVTFCTGSWYAFALAGDEPPQDWADRVARLVWRSLRA